MQAIALKYQGNETTEIVTGSISDAHGIIYRTNLQLFDIDSVSFDHLGISK